MPRSSKHPLTQAREAQNLTQPQLAKAVKLSSRGKTTGWLKH